MSVVERWFEKAAEQPRRVLLADHDQRAIEAADRLNRDGLAEALIVGRDVMSLAEVGHRAAQEHLAALAAVTEGPWAGRFLDLDDPLVIATALVQSGWADAAVGGATRATSDVIRAGLRVLGTRPGVETVSSCFLLVLPDGQPVVFGDCGVVPDPSSTQLCDIARDSAATFQQLVRAEPVVALLSFSTKGSAEHPRVDKIRTAVDLLRAQAPELSVDGELQFDAAWDPEVAAIKAPDSSVAGRANVFVFPDLDSGNIAYKLTERLGGAQAFGPLLQGFNGVLHDLSRGCSVEDMVAVSVIAALQAQPG